MLSEQSRGILHDVRTIYGLGAVGGMTDAELLDRFLERGDEASQLAFEALVRRHGPMVLRVGRDILTDADEAQDVLQATFLVLARRARSIGRPESLGPWLFGVARRVAKKARAHALRRRDRERQSAERNGRSPTSNPDESKHWLHDEIARLPRPYREPLILCYLEGMTYDRAARSLRLSETTVRGRLARARNLLRARIECPAFLPLPTLGLAALPPKIAAAAIPQSIVDATVRAAVRHATTEMTVPATVAGAMEGFRRITSMIAVNWIRTASLSLGLAATGAVVLAHQGDGPKSAIRTVPGTRAPVQGRAIVRLVAHKTPTQEQARTVLTLDLAIDRLLRDDPDLVAKFSEIPRARADVLAAGLRADPSAYDDTLLVPYEIDSIGRQGGPTSFTVGIPIPLDLAQKRRARRIAASRPNRVIEAQYQDAVRLKIDELYKVYADVIEARKAVHLQRARLKSFDELLAVVRGAPPEAGTTKSNINRVKIQRDNADTGLKIAEERLDRVRRAFFSALKIEEHEASRLEIGGEIPKNPTAIPHVEELVRIALGVRPELIAMRLVLGREDYRKLEQAVKTIAPVDRGSIARTKLNIAQTQIQLASLEKMVAAEVKQAHEKYETHREAARKLKADVLPAARRSCDETRCRFVAGEAGIFEVINQYRDETDFDRQWLDAEVLAFRSRLELQTAIGQRIAP